MAPPHSPKQGRGTRTRKVSYDMDARRSSTGDFIDQTLMHMGEDELTDTIRLAQRLLKAKVLTRHQAQEANGEKRQNRFWVRPLQLDWNSTGLPLVQYPRGRARSEGATLRQLMSPTRTSSFGGRNSSVGWGVSSLLSPTGGGRTLSLAEEKVDWRVFELLSPKSKSKMKERLADADIDWSVLSLMSPKSNAKIVDLFLAEEDFDEGDYNAVDWSNNKLPYYNQVAGANRRRNRLRIHERRVHGSANEKASVAPPRALLLKAKQMGVKSPNPRTLNSLMRARGQIQQPCGGGR